MARMTATDLVSYVRKALGNPTTTELADTDLLRFINLAQVRVAMTHKPPELLTSTTLTTAAGTYDYEVSATDVLHIVDARNATDGMRIKPGSLEDWIRDNQDSTVQQGAITRWIEYGVGANGRPNIRLHMAPDAVYSVAIYYLKKPTELVTSPTATTSILREQWDEVILSYAVEIGQSILQQQANAAATRQLAGSVEGRASGGVLAPDRRWNIESRVAPETRKRGA